MTPAPWIAVALLLTMSAPALAAAPTGISHDPPQAIAMGEVAPVTVKLEALSASEEPTVILYFRSQGQTRYQHVEMRDEGGGVFAGQIPGTATQAPSVRYYFEATGPGGAWHLGIGSAASPMGIMLERPEQVGSEVGPAAMLAVFPILLVGFVFWRRERKRKNQLIDQLFWAQLLGPLARMRKASAQERIEVLCERTFDHPIEGPRSWSKAELLLKLDEVRRLDRTKLEQKSARILGSEAPVLSVPAANEPVEDRLGRMAARVARMCSAAWFLTHCREASGEPAGDLAGPLSAVSGAVLELRRLLESGNTPAVEAQLEELGQRIDRLRLRLARLDDGFTGADLAYHLSTEERVSSEVLGRLLEHYALDAQRDAANRGKLLVVARELARRDSVEAGQPDAVRHALKRRGLLRGADGKELEASLLRHAQALRATIVHARVTDPAELEPIQGQIDHFGAELGKLLYTVRGLSEVVALLMDLEARVAELRRRQLAELENLSGDLHDVTVEEEDDDDRYEMVDEEMEVLELLEAVEADLKYAVAEDDCPKRGFYLDDFEQQAVGNPCDDPPWSAVVARAAACRAAIDGLARRHARAAQADGAEPPPMPLTLARLLVRQAMLAESDLRDHMDKNRVLGHAERVGQAERLCERLSRARLGLSVLGRFSEHGGETGGSLEETRREAVAS